MLTFRSPQLMAFGGILVRKDSVFFKGLGPRSLTMLQWVFEHTIFFLFFPLLFFWQGKVTGVGVNLGGLGNEYDQSAQCNIPKQSIKTLYNLKNQYYGQSNMEMKGFMRLHFHITVYHQKKSRQELKKTGTWRQELIHRPRRDAAYLLGSHGLLNFAFW